MEEIKMEPEKKKFKFKIRLEADYYQGDNPNAELTFEQAANLWYNTVGKSSLIAFFDGKSVKDYSYINNFTFRDSVDKEAYE